MKDFLMEQGLSEGVVETIKWWIPYLGFFVGAIAIVIIISFIRKKAK